MEQRDTPGERTQSRSRPRWGRTRPHLPLTAACAASRTHTRRGEHRRNPYPAEDPAEPDFDDAETPGWFALTDVQFSVVALMTPEGRIVERVVYDPYGRGRHHYAADYDGNGAVEVPDLNGTYGHLTAWFADDMQADWDRNGTTYGDTPDIFAFQTDWFAQSGSAGALGGAGQISRRYAAGSGINANAPDNMIGYCGYVFNPETDDYTVRFRHYDPEIGRWLERDPLRYIDSMSLYAYTTGEPIGHTDPQGRDKVKSGIRVCKGYDPSSAVFNQSGHPAHYYIEVDGVGWGRFEVSDSACGTAHVRYDDHQLYPTHPDLQALEDCRVRCDRRYSKHVSPIPRHRRSRQVMANASHSDCLRRCNRDFPAKRPSQSYAICRDIMIDKCCDVEAFKRGIQKYIDREKNNPGRYMIVSRDCKDFAEDALRAGNDEMQMEHENRSKEDPKAKSCGSVDADRVFNWSSRSVP